MSAQVTNCCKHGAQEIAIACIHVCRAIDTGENVGFFWWAESDAPRPDCWCRTCEQWNRMHLDRPVEEWMRVADFQLLCIRCWDEAKSKLYDAYVNGD